MTEREQYKLALRCIRFLRAYNRKRMSGMRPEAPRMRLMRLTLHYAIDWHVFMAAVKTINDQRYSDMRFSMAGRILDSDGLTF